MKRSSGALLLLLLAGCSGIQTMTEGAGRQGLLFNRLFGIFLWVTVPIYAVVILFLLWAVVRRSGVAQDGLPDARPSPGEPGLRSALAAWIAVISIGLLGLTIASYVTDRGMAKAGATGVPLRIKVTAEQWWWRIEYLDPIESNHVVTANELHLPVNTPVQIELASDDVIHSFWVPALAGKQDLIPGRSTDISLLSTRIGHYRGQCAEFCGTQHANMALEVFVEPAAEFAAWRLAQMQPAAAPATALAQAGHDFFMTHQCSSCHAIAGTNAFAQVAPDLTHFASRPTIGAGTLRNTPGNLYGWVEDPQQAKPGNHMPVMGLQPRDLDAVVAYLETLK